MKTLVLAEKPSVGKDIARVLGCRAAGGFYESGEYVVTWALGHLVTLADPEAYGKKYEKWDLADLPIIPAELELVVIGKTSKQYHTVKTQMQRKDISQIVIATDAGREGELVARWIIEKAKIRKPLKRLWISSVTDKAIREGFQKLRDGREYENLYRSAVARAEADWIVGINATRALTTKHNAQLSCGRVQTPTLSMIARREDEIRRFVPKPYYGITAQAGGITFTWQGKGGSSTFDETACDKALAASGVKSGVVVSLTKTSKKTQPPLLYDLTQLQADANRAFNFSAKETLSVMQSLYETHKVLTYPRTDSRYLTTDITDTLPDRIKACMSGPLRKFAVKLQASRFSKSAPYINDQKVSDHHAIIPTEQPVPYERLNDKERKIYDMVVRRFFAALYPPFLYEQTEIVLKIGTENFTARGKKVTSNGFREVLSHSYDENDDEQAGDSQLLPDINKGDSLPVTELRKTIGKTKPPAPFNEASLLTAMENPTAYMETDNKELLRTIGETGGLGTVATRADIIEKLFNSFVVEKRGKDIFITPKGKQLLQLAPKELRSPTLTASWERRLMRISKGHESAADFKREIVDYTRSVISQIKSDTQTFKHDNISAERCPECGKLLLNVNGKKGKLLVCQDRECGYRKSVTLMTNARCPNCHKRLELIGDGDKRKFICPCGHRESYEAFNKRREADAGSMSKKEVQRYLSKTKEEAPINNPFAAALAGLSFGDDDKKRK